MTWRPIATAPKDGTVVDLWIWGEENLGHVLLRASWCNSADRDPIDYGPNGIHAALGLTGWRDEFLLGAGAVYSEEQFSHWRASSLSKTRPSRKQIEVHRLLAKLRGTNY